MRGGSKLVLMMCAALAFTPAPARARDKALEAMIAGAMESGDAAALIRRLARGGHVKQKPDARVDYTDYRKVAKPLDFEGQTIVVIEEEYMKKFVGCCVNEGFGFVIRVNSDAEGLKARAKAAKCAVSDESGDRDILDRLRIRRKEARYMSVSCRANDRG